MKRQQIHDRYYFDHDDRVFILSKSSGRCAHCGKKISIGREATVDHFIPISKGGINQKLNTIMLCEDCNKEKGNKIVFPENYIRYLAPKYQKEISDYFESYIKSFEYITRGNLLCCDEYVYSMYMGPEIKGKNLKRREEIERHLTQYFVFSRSTPNDVDEMTQYFIDYLKKHDQLHSEDAARKNIEFWRRFGVIYCVRNARKEICLLMPITVTKYSDGVHALHIYLFPMYQNQTTAALVYSIPAYVCRIIVLEQSLPFIRSCIHMFKNDSTSRFLRDVKPMDDNLFVESRIMYAGPNYEKDKTYDDEDFEFYHQFHDVERYLDQFFLAPGYEEISFMGRELISSYEFNRETALAKAGKRTGFKPCRVRAG